MNIKWKGRISPNVLLLGAVSFLNDASSEMIMPILPMFITYLGGAGMAVGLVGGVRDSVASILKIFCGYWSDRTGKRKIFVTSGYLSSSVFKLLLVLSRTWHQVFIFSGLERVGKVHAIIDGNQRAYVSDLASGESRATALGTFHAVVGLAALPAGILAGLLWQRVNPAAAFVCGGAISLIAAALFIMLGCIGKSTPLPNYS